MKRLKVVIVIAVLIILIGNIACFRIINTPYDNDVDIVALNSIAKLAAREWGCLERLKEQKFDYDYVIFDKEGKLVFCSSNKTIDSVESAIKHKQSYINITEAGEFLGTAVILTNNKEIILKRKKQVIEIIILVGILEILLITVYTMKVYKQILQPFEKLQGFAQEVARGNLEMPLEMDQSNIFGAFTESFDVMREELKIARKKEYEANQSKKELIAALSHDIKTPVTGIKLISELLELQIEKPELKEKVTTIYTKAEQINTLITDMFQATLEELGEFKVEPKDEYSSKLGEIFEKMDYEKLVHQEEIPACMIYMDTLRMEQVISNIISNSYKYAGTNIEVRYTLIKGYLQVEVKDFGEGVLPEELPLIFNKFYRSKREKVQQKSGVGLGLYIAKTLMEKMGGEMNCFNEEDGFVLRLLVPISCAALSE